MDLTTEVNIVAIEGVNEAELDTIRELLAVWSKKRPRNLLRTAYYDGKATLRHIGISLPPQMHRVGAVLGWPEKAVRSLAHRNIWDGFVTPGESQDPFELSGLLGDNRFDLELPQAIVSTYKHSCSFLTLGVGDVSAGDPEVVVMARSAEWSAALWDKRRRVVSAYLAITDVDDKNADVPIAMTVYLPDVVISCEKVRNVWRSARQPNPLGEVLVEPLVYDPQLDRPFGRSRITRAVMDITDRALRTLLRAETSAEFYASPQRYLLGADEDAFSDTSKWQALVGRFLAITKDEDGDVPTVGQFQQMTMQPHLDMFRQLAAQFSGETGVPLNSLGVVQDNPSSAEAIYAAKEDLIVDALAANRVFSAALVRVAQKAVMLRDDMDELTPELRLLEARWRNPAMPSPVSASDALVKQAAVFPWLSETEVALEMVGYSQADITRLLSDKRRAQGRSTIEALVSAQPAQVDGVEG